MLSSRHSGWWGLFGLWGIALGGAAIGVSFAAAGILAVVFGATAWIIYRMQRAQEEEAERVSKKLKKRNRQKSKYTKKLKRLTRQQSEIISAISHEFKNPVAAIIGYAQTIHDDPNLPPELRDKFLEKVIANSERISAMIDRLSLAIKLESHTLEPRKESFDLAALTEEIAENLRQKYPERTLMTDLQPTPVTADRIMFAQVITNLLDNALKYSEEAINVILRENTFRVIDRGIGIAAEELDKVTRRFFRADTQSWDNSLGVGLYIVEYILRLHHTRLEISSTPGKGSTFGFVLPDKGEKP